MCAYARIVPTKIKTINKDMSPWQVLKIAVDCVLITISASPTEPGTVCALFRICCALCARHDRVIFARCDCQSQMYSCQCWLQVVRVSHDRNRMFMHYLIVIRAKRPPRPVIISRLWLLWAECLHPLICILAVAVSASNLANKAFVKWIVH